MTDTAWFNRFIEALSNLTRLVQWRHSSGVRYKIKKKNGDAHGGF